MRLNVPGIIEQTTKSAMLCSIKGLSQQFAYCMMLSSMKRVPFPMLGTLRSFVRGLLSSDFVPFPRIAVEASSAIEQIPEHNCNCTGVIMTSK